MNQIDTNDLTAQFRDPGAAYRGKPFWSWNGELDEAELLRQIDVMQEMGLGGFFMHSRTGLVTEYLGEEWFRLTNVCADEAQKRGLEAWLYDEDRWPSGTAGGMVTEDPRHRLKFMGLHTVPGTEFTWQDEMIAFACHLDGVSFTDCVRLGSGTPASEYHDKTVLLFGVEQMDPSSFYNGETYVDTLSRAATDRYLELTHEQYQARCGERLGRSIQGIFTDEPHRGAAFTGFGMSNTNRLWMTPWTEELPARFTAQFGGDLIESLPALFLRPGGESVQPVKWQYMELLQQMFLANFAKPLYDWCESHQMRLTGHALHEDSLTAQAAMQGSLMRFYEYLHCPGVDVLSEGNRHFPIVKQLTSAARQLGRTWLLSELYGCTGWQIDFEAHKRAGDWQALFGVNLRCHHLSWYTMAGEAKRDYPASILHQSAWWKHYTFVESYFARLGLLLMQGQPCCDILVLNPVESVWCQIGAGWAEGLSPKTEAVQELENAYTQLSYWLLGAHLDFDYGDEEMLGRLSRLDAGRIHVGEAAYRAVVVGRHTTLRSSTLRLLIEFHEQGGTVIFAGEPPPCVDALPSSEPAALAARATALPWDKTEVVTACRAAVRESVWIEDSATGQPLSEVLCQLRAEGERRYLVAINMSDSQTFASARLRVSGVGIMVETVGVEEWDCRTGERFAVAARSSGSGIEFSTDFPPSGERAFVLTPAPDASLTPRPAEIVSGEEAAPGPFAYTLGEENVCVLDFARCQINSEDWQGASEVLKVDQAVRTALGVPTRSGEMVQPWHRKKYDPAPLPLAAVRLAFEFDIETLPDTPVFLGVEQPEAWRLTLNGQPLPPLPDGWWVDTAFQKIPIPSGLLHLGRNELLLKTEFRTDINIEAVYLLGGFGVRLGGTCPVLTRLPERLEIGDLTAQGLPFYGGAVTYHLLIPEAAKNAVRLSVTAPSFEAACLRVEAGAEAHVIAWPPYRATLEQPKGSTISLEVVLTRRNTFGPLHQIPLRAGAYGPGNFTTRGDDFSDAYMLYPAGLLLPPVLSWQKS